MNSLEAMTVDGGDPAFFGAGFEEAGDGGVAEEAELQLGVLRQLLGSLGADLGNDVALSKFAHVPGCFAHPATLTAIEIPAISSAS